MSIHEWTARRSADASPASTTISGWHRRCPLLAVDVAHAGLYGPRPWSLPLIFGTLAALVFDSQIAAAGPAARHFRHADDGDAGGRRAGLDDDVPSPARRAQLSAVARRHRPAGVGIQPDDCDPVAGAGRDMAVDAAGHADRAGRPGRDAARAL